MHQNSSRQYLFLLLIILTPNWMFSQILNGEFEDWIYLPDSTEIPVYWDVSNNDPESITKSLNSNSGFFSAKIASLNQIEGSNGPASILTKFSPISLNYKIAFNYLIDSINGLSNIVVQVLQKNNSGHYTQILNNSYNEISKDFIKIDFEIHLPNLDSVFLRFSAKNHQLIFGYDGFISFFLDDVEVEIVSGTNESAKIIDTVVYPNPASGIIYIKSDNRKNKTYKIISTSGVLYEKGYILEDNISLPLPGIFILQLTGDDHMPVAFTIVNKI